MLTRLFSTICLTVGLWPAACGDTSSNLITAAGAARPCTRAADCSTEKPVCDPSSGRCVECRGNEDCAGQERRLCNLDSHRCVECLVDGHCMSITETCSLVLGSCAVKCSSKSDCPGTDPYCDTGIGYCVECETDTDCAGSPQPFCRGSLCTGP